MPTQERDETTLKTRRKVALVIGIGRYDNIEPLENSENGPNDISGALESIDFIVTKKLNIKRTGMKYAVFDFEKVIEPGDIVLFYFAGHGTQWEMCIENLSYKIILIHYG